MVPEKYKIKNTIKFPTSIIIGGLSKLGLEISNSLIEQGGYVIIIDNYDTENLKKLDSFTDDSLVSFLDFTAIPHLEDEIRRLDYIFYFNYESSDLDSIVSTQEFLTFSNYVDATLSLASKFDAKYLLATSIRGNQMSLLNEEMVLNYGVNSTKKHLMYTNKDLQKYSEGLVLEYVEKTNLDARITRLGEIIGDGIDFSIDTIFLSLILNAAKGESLKLRKDGLESEYYIHLLDAAYGIIKAQFSRNTKGEVYSLCYEQPFTSLSIAYKIQEIDNDGKDIVFVEEKDNLPSLKLYKPAPNLSAMGWEPKVSFDKAIKQSIAAAKIYLLEIDTPEYVHKTENYGVLDKLKEFFVLSDASDKKKLEEPGGAVARLISERRRQEELKKRSLEYASVEIKSKKRQRPRSFGEKSRNFVWGFLLDLGKTFSIFKNKTPTEIGLIIVGLAFLFIFYLFIFSPVAVITKDILNLIPEYQTAKAAIAQNRYSDLEVSVNEIENNLKDIKLILSRYSVIASTVSVQKQYIQINNVLDSYINICDGYSNIGYALEPFYNYLKVYQNNTQVRNATDTNLSLSQNASDYSTVLNDLNSRSASIDLGVNKIQKASALLSNVDYNLIPSFLAQYLIKYSSEIQGYSQNINYIQSTKYLSELLGVSNAQHYLILVMDNTKPTPAGGEIAAYALITLKNGGIVESTVQSPDNTKFNFSSLDSRIYQEINARRFNYITPSNITLNDLSSIRDYPLFSKVTSKVFEDTFNRSINATIEINYSALSDITKTISSRGGSLVINSESFNTGDLLQNIKSGQNGTETIKSKHDITSQLLAAIINNIFSSPKDNISNILSTLSSNAISNNLLIDASSLNYSNYISNMDLNAENINNSDLVVTPSILVSDPKIVNQLQYPSTYTASVVNINNDLSVKYNIDLKFPNIGGSEEVSLCVPSSVESSSIQVSNIPSTRVAINTVDNIKCIAINIITENEVNISFLVPALSLTQNNGIYNIQFGIGNIRGSSVTSDLKLSGSGINITSINPQNFINNNSVAFTQKLLLDQIVNLTLKK